MPKGKHEDPSGNERQLCAAANQLHVEEPEHEGKGEGAREQADAIRARGKQRRQRKREDGREREQDLVHPKRDLGAANSSYI